MIKTRAVHFTSNMHKRPKYFCPSILDPPVWIVASSYKSTPTAGKTLAPSPPHMHAASLPPRPSRSSSSDRHQGQQLQLQRRACASASSGRGSLRSQRRRKEARPSACWISAPYGPRSAAAASRPRLAAGWAWRRTSSPPSRGASSCPTRRCSLTERVPRRPKYKTARPGMRGRGSCARRARQQLPRWACRAAAHTSSGCLLWQLLRSSLCRFVLLCHSSYSFRCRPLGATEAAVAN